MTKFDYDLFVIGGGSGGVRAARMAGKLGRRVAIAEEDRFGGTCVIRGCVPKKLFVYASQFKETFEDAAGFGWTVPPAEFDWRALIANKDAEIGRLEKAYRDVLETGGVEIFAARATIESEHEIRIDGRGGTVTAERIVVATGGLPSRLPNLPGSDLCITSDEAFHLEELPASIVIKGGGYIAVEFAGIFAGLGVETTLIYRGDHLLRGFDHDLGKALAHAMEKKGIKILFNRIVEKVERRGQGRRLTLDDGQTIDTDLVMLAVGRIPHTEDLGLHNAGVHTDRLGAVEVDEYSRSNVGHILAVGDVTNRVPLTPVAIHEAMSLVETEFGGRPTPVDHELIPTAIFSQPEIGTVGLGEEAAARRHERLDIYKAEFLPMKHTLSGRDEKMLFKIVADAETERVVGIHLLGADAGELIQALGISIKMGATKADFDRTMAVHPTAAEELVTLYEPSYKIADGSRV